jgi:hypothetical protein
MKHDAWQTWLEAGAPLTPTRRAEIIDEVCARYPDRAAKIRTILSGIAPPSPREEEG